MVLAVSVLILFGELVRLGIAMKVIILGVIGYQAYKWWKYR